MEKVKKLMQQQLLKMSVNKQLFRSMVTGNDVWEIYLNSFGKSDNPVFRDPESSTYNCNHCKNFIRRYGNIVTIDEDYNIITLFDIDAPDEYKNSFKKVSDLLKSSNVGNIFKETYKDLVSLPYEKCNKNNSQFKLGIDKNVKQYTKEEAEKFGVVKPDEIRVFHHFSLFLPSDFVDFSGSSIEEITATYRDAKNVFKRAMDEIPLDTLLLVRDLINQGSLLDGQTHLFKVEQFIPLKEEYDILSKESQDNWCWVNSYDLPIARFKNELIGVLCSELAEGKELNEACQAWNKRVDPINYMKTKAPITKRQIEEAKKFVEDNGYEESFNRRFATIDDIKASEILHVNVGDGKVDSVSIFDDIKATSTRHKRSEFDNIEEVSIEKFMKDILPSCTSVEAYLINKQEGNLVSLTTSNIKNSKPIFKWDNNYSWTFNGNLAGKSMIKEAVKTAGGKIDAVLRCSISWNEDGRSICDFDVHAIEPNGTEIYYGSYKRNKTPMSGMLDVDMIRPKTMGVENITWDTLSKMQDGEYKFFNRNYDRGINTGFKAEIEFNGEIYSYECNGNIQQDTPIATVTLKDGVFSIEHHLPESNSSRELYGLDTNHFHKVNLVCLSPNHWGDNNIGNKFYFFMLEGCKSPLSIRSFHNENLIPELAQHRKVLEVLGNTKMIEPADNQLSGLGFNTTVRDELVVRLKGSFKRIIKIKF